MRYLSQRYSMPYAEAKGLLTDIGTEELGHMEMVAAIVHQLTRNLTAEQLVEQASEPLTASLSRTAHCRSSISNMVSVFWSLPKKTRR